MSSGSYAWTGTVWPTWPGDVYVEPQPPEPVEVTKEPTTVPIWVAGGDIREGDWIYSSRSEAYGPGTWNVIAKKNSEGGMGWVYQKYAGSFKIQNYMDKEVERAFTMPAYEFLIKRPEPEKNEFGEVSP
jgi:hypothetical protein